MLPSERYFQHQHGFKHWDQKKESRITGACPVELYTFLSDIFELWNGTITDKKHTKTGLCREGFFCCVCIILPLKYVIKQMPTRPTSSFVKILYNLREMYYLISVVQSCLCKCCKTVSFSYLTFHSRTVFQVCSYFAIVKLPFFVAYHSYVVEAGPLHMWRKNGIPKFPIIKILFIGANTKVKMWMSRIRMLVLHHKFFRQLVVFKHFTGTFHFLWRSCAHQGLCQFFANYDCNNLFRPLS